MLEGAELILTPNACTLDDHRLSQFKTRALREYGWCSNDRIMLRRKNNGHSVAYDAVAYHVPNRGRNANTLIIEAGENRKRRLPGDVRYCRPSRLP